MVPSPIPHLPCEDEEETDKPPAVPGTGPSLSLSRASHTTSVFGNTEMVANFANLRRSLSGSGSNSPVLKGLLHEIFELWFFALINST